MAATRLDAVDVSLARLESASATLARALHDLDVRAGHVQPAPSAAPSTPGGLTAAYEQRVHERLDWLWDRFSALSEVLSQARTLRTGSRSQVANRVDELGELLHHEATADLLAGTAEAVDAVNLDLDALESARFGNLPALAAAERDLAEAADTALRLGVRDVVPELLVARAALDWLDTTTSSDPMAVGASELTTVVEAVRAAVVAVEVLRRAHASIADELRVAATLLDEVATLAADGEAPTCVGIEETVESENDEASLRLAPGWYDDPSRGLRPWLDRLATYHDAGDWHRASRGLADWRMAATATNSAAARVAARNAALLRRRDDLRGTLRGLHAEAVRNELTEDPDLVTLFRRTREALYTLPTDLDRAAEFVRTYAARLAGRTVHRGNLT